MNPSFPWQLRVAEYLSYAAAIIVPLVWNLHNRHPFITSKVVWIVGLTVTMALFMAWGMIVSKIKYRITGVHIALLIYLTIITIGAIVGIDPGNSLFGDFIRGMSVSLVGFLILFAGVVAELIRRKHEILRRLLTVSFITAIPVALIAFFDEYGFNMGGKLMDATLNGSTVGNSSFLGAYLLFAVFFGVYLLMTSMMRRAKILYGIGIALIAISPTFLSVGVLMGNIPWSYVKSHPLVLMGEAQGAALGIIIGLVVAGLVWVMTSPSRIRRGIAVAVLVVGVITGGILVVQAVTPRTPLYVAITEVKSESRFVFWDIAWQGFKEKPLLGWGYQNYSYVYQQHFDPGVFEVGYGKELWTDSPHNVIFEHLVNTGALGLMAYMSLFVSSIILLIIWYRRSPDHESRAWLVIAVGGIVGYSVQNLFVFDHPVVLFVFFVVIGGIMARVPHVVELGFPQLPVRFRWLDRVLIVIAIGISGYLITVFAILPAREARAWMVLASELPIEDHGAYRKKIQALSWVGSINDTLETAVGFYAPLKKAVSSATVQQRVVLAHEIISIITDLDRELNQHPTSARGYYMTAKYLNLLSTLTASNQERAQILQQAREHSARAFSINPKHPYFFFEAAYTELLDRKPDVAAQFAWRAFQIKKADDEIYQGALQLAQTAGNQELAKKIKQEHSEALAEYFSATRTPEVH